MTDLEISDLEVQEIVMAFTERGVVPNNEQAMALVKKLRLNSNDLNRAIVEFITKILVETPSECPCIKQEKPLCSPKCWHFGSNKSNCLFCGEGRMKLQAAKK